MSGENSLEKAIDIASKKIMGQNGDNQDIIVDSISKLKDELKISKLDTTDLEDLKEPIRVTREELNKLSAELLSGNTDRLQILKNFIIKKTEEKKADVVMEASKGVEDLRNKLGTVTLSGIVATATDGIKKQTADIRNTEGVEKVSKIGEFFEWCTDLWDKFTSFVALKFPTIADFFGWTVKPDLKLEGSVKGPTEDTQKDKQEKKEEGADKSKPEQAEISQPELELKKLVQERKMNMISSLEKRWGVKLDTPERKQKFDFVWSKYESKIEENNKKVLAIPDAKQAVYLSDYPLLYGQDSLNFMFDLVKEGIIPKEALYCEMSNFGNKMIKFSIAAGKELIGLGSDGLQTVLGEISIDELGVAYNKLDPYQKQLLGHILYHKGVLTSYLLGAAGFVIAEAFIVPITWNERVGWTSAKMSWYTAMGKYDKATAGFDELAKMLGNTEGTKAEYLRKGLVEGYAKTLITEAYLRSGEDIGKFKTEIDQLKRFVDVPGHDKSSSLLNEILNKKVVELNSKVNGLKQGSRLSELLINDVLKESWSSPQLNTMETRFSRIKEFFTGTPSAPQKKVDEALKAIGSYTEGLRDAVRNREGFNSIISQLRNVFKIHQVPGATNKAIAAIHVSDATKAGQLASRLLQECPSLAKAFFNNLAIVIVVSGVMAEGQDQSVMEKTKKFAEGMSMMFPGVAVYHMIREGSKYEKGSFSNIGLIGGGVVIGGLEASQFLKAIGSSEKGWNLFKFFGRPIIAPIEFLGGVSKTGYGLYKGISAIIEAWKIGEMGTVFSLCRKGVLSALAIATIAICAKWTYQSNKKITDEEMVAELKNKGIVDAQGNYDPNKIKENLAGISDQEREKIIKSFAMSILNKEAVSGNRTSIDQASQTEVSEKDFDIKKEGNKFVIVFNDCVKFFEKKCLEGEFRDLGIDVICRYGSDAVKKFAKTYKQNGYTKEIFVENMQTLGIKGSEAYWEA